MACHWRIRHKLMLGLGLVVGVIALLLGGTLKGLASYRATMKIIDSKLAELQELVRLKAAITDLITPAEPGAADEPAKLRAKVRTARQALAAYQDRLSETVQLRRDHDQGHQETHWIEALTQDFDQLDLAVNKAVQPVSESVSTQPLLGDRDVRKAVNDLVRDSTDLLGTIFKDMYRRIATARSHYRSSLTVVVAVSAGGVLLLVGLLRFFYTWTFYPLRDLHQGVGRVARGDFDHRIEVRSGDEMEELAGAFNDMTGRLQDMYRDLARQVNERSRQLVRSERLAGVGFLAAGVAHEINNPLASIAFCSEALEQRLFPKDAGGRLQEERQPDDESPATLASSFILHPSDKEVITRYLKMIQEEAFRCKNITQRLLEFSRGGERRREPTDLAELIQAVLDVVQHLEHSKGKHIAFTPPPKLVAWVNAQEVKSVVLNLVVNALESMDEGGTLAVRLRQVPGKAAGSGWQAELEFADTGCGMTAEVLENIFEPFFTRSRTGKGTGLGLSISHRIISQHGGEVEAASPGPGRGSTFLVRLPLQPAEEQESGARNHGSEVEAGVAGRGPEGRKRAA